MSQLDVLDFKTGKVIEQLEIPVSLMEVSERTGVLDFISNYLYKTKKLSFRKTASSKGISDISGTTKKPHNQKGTGNARQGSLRSPQFRGGAVIFGPIPVTASYKINKKERTLAKQLVLSELINNSLLKVVDSMSGITKTKEFASHLQAFLPGARKVIFVSHNAKTSADFYLAGKNIKGISFDLDLHFNIYKVSTHEVVVITKDALKELFNNLFN